MQIMDDRLGALLSLEVHSSILAPESHPPPENTRLTQVEALKSVPAPGWRLLDDQSGWRSSPIGVYVHPTSKEGEYTPA